PGGRLGKGRVIGSGGSGKPHLSRSTRPDSTKAPMEGLQHRRGLQAEGSETGDIAMSTQEGAGYSQRESAAIAAAPVTLDAVRVTPDACAPEQCEMALNLGLFFDGTGNNWWWKEAGQS